MQLSSQRQISTYFVCQSFFKVRKCFMESGASVVHSTNNHTKALLQGNQDIKYAPLLILF